MEIIIGKTAGFCFGVKRAVDTSMKMLSDKKVYCLGELVHNKEVIKRLEDKGIKVIENIDEIKNKTCSLIIRAHGIDRKIYDSAIAKGIEVIDLTCPFVSKIHDIASEYQKKGYYIFLLGNRTHPEIIGTASYCGNNYSIIEDEEDVSLAMKELLQSKINNLLIVVQTTFSKTKFSSIEMLIKNRIGSKINIVSKNTICMATEERQKETEELSKRVDLMIIIGGKNSSNTAKLYEISKQNTNAILIETSSDLDLKVIKKYQKIGIMAGASTPQESIDDVVCKIQQ